ncbi:phosphate/phosphite/phosphonate ABC transporter substrate-binding protein [Desulfobacula toluolica]|uniref:Phosphonates-binding periplasmic protein n=1 Tax=Desulfobacula toluolica (strain DSM 7467 / Tol2) TaxID=651182 RepID=K0NMX2_DESTT|nr:phosphate/phosphite/phosphonate ABC transporter substrate-binding protein [Desulfobacula toluolica]CCK81363.1 phosphonates-binding periplasmic protein [Desulfobacula toluolica Tol2]
MKNFFIIFLIFFGLLFFHKTSPAFESSDADNTTKTPLSFSLIPKKNIDQQISNLAPLFQLLEEKLYRPIKIIRPHSYQAVIEGILSHTIDFAILGPASYAKARARDNRVDAFASFTTKKGFTTPQGSYYHSILFTLRHTGCDTIEKLKGKKIALTDPASTSGAIIPNMVFSKHIGQPLQTFFGTHVYTGSHDRSIKAIANGFVDAAFVASVRIDEAVQKKLIPPDQIVILWRSNPIHYDPFVFGGSVNEPLRTQLKNIILSSASPQLEQMLNNMQLTGIEKVCNEDYQAIHDIIAVQTQKNK